MKRLLIVLSLSFGLLLRMSTLKIAYAETISCITTGNTTICTDLETGRSWTIITSGGQ